MAKHSPATPLPWESAVAGMSLYALDAVGARAEKVASTAPGDSGLRMEDVRKNAAYIAHAANAYPRLIEALREISDGRDLPMHEARALLRDLGEE